MVILVIGMLGLVLAGLGVWWFMNWRRQDRELDAIARRLETDLQIAQFTEETLAEMRAVVRQRGANGWWYWSC